MKTMNWCGYAWKPRRMNDQEFQGNQQHQWFGEDCVSILADGTLALDARYNPKTFTEAGKQYTAEIECGCFTAKDTFFHGKFEICAKLPYGKWLWPAFWLTGAKTWPPEIDIFEGYSDGKKSYRAFQWSRPCTKYAVKTNAWKNVYPDHKQFGAQQHKATKDPDDKWNYFTMSWTPTYVKLYYNGKLVRTFEDMKLLDQMNEQGMRVILNNGCADDADTKDLVPGYEPSTFLVKSFVYTPYKG